MGNALEFILKLTDQLSPAMNAAAAVTDSAAGRIQRDLDRTTGASQKFKYSLSELRQKLDDINKVRENTKIASQFRIATEEARKLQKEIDKLEGKQKTGMGLGGLLGGLLGGMGVGMLGKSALSAAAEREQQKVSFGVMTGSEAAGNKMLSDIVQMGARTPFESGDLIKAAQTMKQFDIENGKVLPNLQMLGDISGGNAEKLQSLSLAYSQVQSTGRLTGQDLLQMINSGFNPLLTISQQTGLSLADLKQKMEDGAISADMVTRAMQTATGPGGQFYQMMEKQSKTLGGRWSTFMDGAKEKLLQLGNALMPIAGWLLDFASAAMSGEPWAVALASAVGILSLSLYWASIRTWAFNAATKSAAFFTGLWSGVQAVFNATLWANPITWVVMGIIALIAAIGYVIYTTDGWGKQWDSLVNFFKHLWNGFVAYFKVLWLGLQDNFMSGLELIEKGWYKLKGLWDSEGAKAGLNAINDQQNQRAAEIAKAKGVMTQEANTAFNSLKWELHGNGKGLGTMVGDMKKKLGLGSGGAGAAGPTSVDKSFYTPDDQLFKDLGNGSAKDKSERVNGGGSRPITINVGKQIENLNLHTINVEKGMDELEAMVMEAMRRVLGSVNNYNTSNG